MAWSSEAPSPFLLTVFSHAVLMDKDPSVGRGCKRDPGFTHKVSSCLRVCSGSAVLCPFCKASMFTSWSPRSTAGRGPQTASVCPTAPVPSVLHGHWHLGKNTWTLSSPHARLLNRNECAELHTQPTVKGHGLGPGLDPRPCHAPQHLRPVRRTLHNSAPEPMLPLILTCQLRPWLTLSFVGIKDFHKEM